MRKLGIFTTLVVAAMAIVSCNQNLENEAPAINNDGAVTFEATFDAVDDRAILKPDATSSKVEWEQGDEVGILVGEGNYLYTAASAGASTTLNTEATDVPSEGDYYAVYPYDSAASLNGAVISTTLPAEQKAVEGSFTTHLAVAKADANNVLAFKNVCGLVMIDVSADVAQNITKIVFEGNNNEVVAGGINVTVSAEPSWSAGEGAKSVSLLPAEGATAISEGRYFFAVLPQTFTKGFKVTAYSGENSWEIRNVTTEVTIGRSAIVAGKEFILDGDGTESNPYLLRNAADMVGMREKATEGGTTYFKMVNNIDMEDVTNYVPVNYDNNFTRQIHFDGGGFTLSNFTCTSETHTGDYPSLFGVLYGSCKNLNIDNATIESAGDVVGIIGGYVGTSGKPGLVENVTVTNSSVTSNTARAGGLCGVAREATFINCYAEVNVTSSNTEVGGFVGRTQGTSTFTDCNVKATVETTATTESHIGGFVGSIQGTSEFTNCDGEVVVTTSGNDAGGFAGKIQNPATFTNCDVKATVTSTITSKNRVGGFIGWNAGSTTTITNCHVLEGSLVTAGGVADTAQRNFGGFIGYGDADGAVLKISNSSSAADVEPGKSAFQSAFIGGLGYASTTTIENCYATGDVTAVSGGGNYTAGLIGGIDNASAKVTITDSYYSGNVTGASGYVAGIVGGAKGDCDLARTYSTGKVTSSGQYVGGLIGAAMNAGISVTNCWSSAEVYAKGQQSGGLIGTTTLALEMSNCFASGNVTSDTAGSAGIVGRVAVSSSITNCIAWNKEIICGRTATDKYAPGAILGCAQEDGTYSNCWRRADMTFTDGAGSELSDQDAPTLPTGLTATHQKSYHGKAAAADATISSVASSLGWDTTVWDLTGDVPVLK